MGKRENLFVACRVGNIPQIEEALKPSFWGAIDFVSFYRSKNIGLSCHCISN